MRKNLETADTAVKLILALAVIVFYVTNTISGPIANILLFFSATVVIIFVAKVIINMLWLD